MRAFIESPTPPTLFLPFIYFYRIKTKSLSANSQLKFITTRLILERLPRSFQFDFFFFLEKLWSQIIKSCIFRFYFFWERNLQTDLKGKRKLIWQQNWIRFNSAYFSWKILLIRNKLRGRLVCESWCLWQCCDCQGRKTFHKTVPRSKLKLFFHETRCQKFFFPFPNCSAFHENQIVNDQNI